MIIPTKTLEAYFINTSLLRNASEFIYNFFTNILNAYTMIYTNWSPIFILNSNFIFQSVILFKNSISNHLKAQVILDRKPIQFSAPFIFSHSTMGTHGLIVLFPTKVASTQFHNIIFVHQRLSNFINLPYYH